MEKIIRYILVALILVLLAALGFLAIRNSSLRSELAVVRSDYSVLEQRNIELAERNGYYAGLARYINDEIEKLDQRFRDAVGAAGAGISGLQGQVDALRKWGESHRSLESEIIKRLEGGAVE